MDIVIPVRSDVPIHSDHIVRKPLLLQREENLLASIVGDVQNRTQLLEYLGHPLLIWSYWAGYPMRVRAIADAVEVLGVDVATVASWA